MSYVKTIVREWGIHTYHNKYEHPAIINLWVTQKRTDSHTYKVKNTDKKDLPLKKPFPHLEAKCVNPAKTQLGTLNPGTKLTKPHKKIES